MGYVLVVEDEPGVREFLREALGRAGIRLRMAANGTQALALAGRSWPGAVLLDLTLPGRMDGWQVWDGLSEMAAGRSLNVVVFAADLDGADRAAASDRAAWAVLRKPVSGTQLIQIVREAVAGT